MATITYPDIYHVTDKILWAINPGTKTVEPVRVEHVSKYMKTGEVICGCVSLSRRRSNITVPIADVFVGCEDAIRKATTEFDKGLREQLDQADEHQ